MAVKSSSARGDQPDLLTAAIFVALGTLGLWAGRTLPMGTPAAMGPGFVPTAICWMLVAVGLWVGLLGLRKTRDTIDPVKWRPVSVITLSIVGFAYVASFVGFVAAALWLIVVGSFAEREVRVFETVTLAIGLTIFGAAVFVLGLGVQIKLLPF